MDQCGDTAIYLPGDDTCFLALADVLGHGAQAGTSPFWPSIF
jgi:hypothetical protein